MNVSEQTTDGALVLSVSGRLDSMTSESFEQLLMSRIDAGQTKLVIDFSDLSYISSAGLRVLLMAAKRLKKEAGAFALCRLGDPIREVLEISGFLSILTVVDNQDAAVAAVNA
jgi:anti-anti-sigma factor